MLKIPPPVAAPRFSRSHLFVGLAVVVVVLGAITVALLFSSSRSGRRVASNLSTGIARVIIPEARAADAFSVKPERADGAGMEIDSGFEVTSRVNISAARLQQTLQIVPAVPFTVERKDSGVFRVKLASLLAPGTIFQVAVPTLVAKADGSSVQRDFSWAFQTKNDFRVLSTVPGDGSAGVPVNTGLEFKLSRDGWEDATSSFRITPSVPGRFEAHGRVLAFVPDKLLAYGTRYEVVLAKGFKLKDSVMALAHDSVIRFETEAEAVPAGKPVPWHWEINEFNEAIPGKDLRLPVYAYDRTVTNMAVAVSGYALSEAQARELLLARYALPAWTPIERERFADYKRLTHAPIFTLNTKLDRTGEYGPFVLTLPKQNRAGFLALKIVPAGGEETWIFVQVTPAAAYLVADTQSLLAWVVNASTQRPLSHLPVILQGASATTDERGLAHLPVPSILTAMNTNEAVSPASRLIEIGSGEEKLFVMLSSRNSGSEYLGYWGIPSDVERTWGYLYLDRSLYRQSDEINFFGLAQDRETRHGAGAVEVRLQRESYTYDEGTGGAKIYQQKFLTTDEMGSVSGNMSWENLAPGSYSLKLVREGKEVAWRTFEVREFIKPAYAIAIQPDQERLFAGQSLHGSVSVAFYDGTPLARGHFKLTHRQGELEERTEEIVTDENGRATFQIPTTVSACASSLQVYCNTINDLVINVQPILGEEADLTATARVQVFSSELRLDIEPTTTGTQATIAVQARHADLTKPDDWRGEVWPERDLQGEIVGRYWEQIPDGTYYDFTEKVTRPRYRYEERMDPPVAFHLKTDGSGHARYAFTMDPKKRYDVTIEGVDTQNRIWRSQTWVAQGWYEHSAADMPSTEESAYPALSFLPPDQRGEFALDEHVTFQYVRGRDPLDVSRTPGVLFMRAQGGIKSAVVSASPTYTFSFTVEMVPNITVRAVTFVNGHFETVQNSASYKVKDQALDISARLDQERYAPGATIKIHVTAKKQGSDARAAYAKLAWAAVDQALADLSGMQPEQPLDELYRFVPEGIIWQAYTHEEPLMRGGAEKGGGGGGDYGTGNGVRRIFKDTAAFEVTELDQNGETDISFKAPDNLTSWRVQLVAVSPTLQAGGEIVEVPVTKSVFVDVVAPPRVLSADKPILKLRAFGSALPAHASLTFTVDAPSLGISNQVVTGTSDAPAYIALAEWPVGHHVITVRVTSPQGTDAIERAIDVVATRFLKDEYVSLDVTPSLILPELGAPEAEIVFASRGRAMLLPRIEALTWGAWSARLDSKIAARLMQEVLKNKFGRPVADDQPLALGSYQDMYGGLKPLPHASADTELSADVAATAPDLIDRSALANYLWHEADRRDASREVRIAALSGLASLHESTLPSLQALAEVPDLTWREQLMVARGLLAVGDRERAAIFLERWLAHAQSRDALMFIPVSDKPAEIYEATAEAAALAALLTHPKAQALSAYVETNWQADAFPVLARVRYVLAMLSTLSDQAATATWTIDGRNERTISLKDQPTQSVLLTAAEARRFHVTKVSGPMAIEFIRRVSGRPAAVPEVSVTRSYQAPKSLNQLMEGDVVRVTVTSTISDKAQDGCYVMRDHLPGGWQPVVRTSYDAGPGWILYPYDVSDGEVSFVICGHGEQAVTYLARIVSRGSFKAEAPLLQHLQYPAVAALGKDETVTVR